MYTFFLSLPVRFSLLFFEFRLSVAYREGELKFLCNSKNSTVWTNISWNTVYFIIIVLFRKKVYKARKQLAAIDWNYHLDIPEQEDVLGEVAVTRKYNQRTKSWNVKIVKQAKDYIYRIYSAISRDPKLWTCRLGITRTKNKSKTPGYKPRPIHYYKTE